MNDPAPGSVLNGDGRVSIGDLALITANYGKTKATRSDWNVVKKYDLNQDDTIDIEVLATVAMILVEVIG